MAEPDARFDQRMLESKRAAENETHEVGAPDRNDVVHLLDRRTVAENAIAGEVAPDVDIGPERRQAPTARLALADDVAGF